MASWILTKGLENLLRQINAWAPQRDHASDGEVGDLAHQQEVSGHNPDRSGDAEYRDGDSLNEVRALDIDIDFANGVSAQTVVDHLRALPRLSSVIRYMIYNRKMYHERNGFQPVAYTGPSAHTEHIHFSGAWTQAADNDTTFNYQFEEIPVALTTADKTWIQQTVSAAANAAVDEQWKRTALKDATGKPDGTFSTPAGNDLLSQGIPDGTDPEGGRAPAWVVIENLGNTLVAVLDKLSTPPVPAADGE